MDDKEVRIEVSRRVARHLHDLNAGIDPVKPAFSGYVKGKYDYARIEDKVYLDPSRNFLFFVCDIDVFPDQPTLIQFRLRSPNCKNIEFATLTAREMSFYFPAIMDEYAARLGLLGPDTKDWPASYRMLRDFYRDTIRAEFQDKFETKRLEEIDKVQIEFLEQCDGNPSLFGSW